MSDSRGSGDSYEGYIPESSDGHYNNDSRQFRNVVLGELVDIIRDAASGGRNPHKNLSSMALKAGANEFTGAVGTTVHLAEFWLTKAERIFSELNFTHEEKFRCAVALLQDEAYLWWKSVTSHMESNQLNWDFFVKNFKERYIGPDYFEKMRWDFMNLKQGSMTIQDYDVEFTRLSTYAPEIIPTEAIKCERFRSGLTEELRTAVVGFNDTVYLELRGRVFSIANSRARPDSPNEKEKSQPKRPSGSVEHSGFSKRAKGAPYAEKSGSHQSHSHQFGKNNSGFRQQQSVSVASTEGSTFQHTTPFCDFCRRHHHGVCWRKEKACLLCGSKEHFIRDCPRNTSAHSRQSTPATSGGRGSGSVSGRGNEGGRGGFSGRGQRTSSNSGVRPETYVAARTYAMGGRDEPGPSDVVAGTFELSSNSALALFDPGSAHSYICENLAKQ